MKSNLNKLSEDWADLKEVILYGFGKEGIKNFDKIARDFRVKCIIDNDISKTDTCYKGIPVLSMEDAKEKLKSYKVIVMTASRAYRSIAVSLMEKGLSMKTFVVWSNSRSNGTGSIGIKLTFLRFIRPLQQDVR